MAKNEKLDTNFVSPICRLSYPALFEAKQMVLNGKVSGKHNFSVTALFDKKTDLKSRQKVKDRIVLNLREAVHNATVNKWGADKAKWPKNLQTPFRDGDAEKPGVLGYENAIFVNFKNERRPGVVDVKGNPITEQDGLIYAGCYGRIAGHAFAWEFAGKTGVSLSLENVMKTGDGEPFGGARQSAQKAFDGFSDDTSEDEDSYDSDFEDGDESDFG